MPACCQTTGQWCSEREVCSCFLSSASGVQESKMLSVDTAEEGLGNNNSHVMAVAMDVDPWS